MKKHPVDDLFKRRLEGLERTPSEQAWLRIQEKQSENGVIKRRPAVWGWYAAAGVAAAVMGGYLVWQNQQPSLPINAEHTMAAVQPAHIDSAMTDSLITPAAKSNAGERLASAKQSSAASPRKQAKKMADANAETVQPPEVQPAGNAPMLAAIERTSVPMNAIQPEPVNIPVAQGIKTLPDEPAVSRVNKPEPEPTRTIVVAVETGNSEMDEKPRDTRFARVFRQLKNARAGEKVDWDEVGFNPKNLVARVDDRLRARDERSNEKDHPKDKAKL